MHDALRYLDPRLLPRHAFPVGGPLVGAALLAVLALGGCQSGLDPETLGQVSAEIRGSLDEASIRPEDEEQRRAWEATVAFYTARDFAPAWIDRHGPGETSEELLAVLESARGEGLDAGNYDLTALQALRERAVEDVEAEAPGLERRLADFDLFSTYTALAHIVHLTRGRVRPEDLGVEWYSEPREIDAAAVLEGALSGQDLAGTLAELAPQDPQYERLVEARERYQAIVEAGGWPQVAAGGALEPGATGPAVATLRRRLAIEGDLPDASEGENAEATFDAALVEAVKRFQASHGLEADGALGEATVQALNVPAADRLRTIELNLERWRWMPEDLGDRYIAVNIPAYDMWVVDGGERVLEMPVIVGKRMNQTPVFSDTMTFLVLNPSWHVPESIATAEILPKIRRDPSYARREGLELTRTVDGQEVAVDPSALVETVVAEEPADDQPWWRFGANRETKPATEVRTVSLDGVRVRQRPGSANPLGRVKFMFPNEHNIYLHDTPGDHLFASADREFSHGCVRLAEPFALADYLLSGQDGWSRQRIDEVLASGDETEVKLDEAMPVHLLYWTAWVADDGAVHFQGDAYGHDARLAQVLAAEPPVTLTLADLHPAAPAEDQAPAGDPEPATGRKAGP